jgi:hypothetical protein
VSLAGDGQASVRGVAALPDGGVVAVGAFEGQLAAGSVAMASGGASDGFALGISPAGRVGWGVALTGSGGQDLTAVAAGETGAVAAIGTATGPARLGGQAVRATGQPAAIAVRLGPGGAPVWQRAIGATGYAVPTALAWTDDGDVVVAGYFAGTLDPGGRALAGAGGLDVWVARLAGADGRLVWLHRAGGPGADTAHAIAVAGGAVVVAGSFQRWADFSSATLRAADDSADPFVAAAGADGFAWARSFPTEGAGAAHALIRAAGERLAVAVTFTGVIGLGESTIRAGRSGERGLVALLDATGAVLWARPIDRSSSADALAIGERGLLVAGASSGGTGYLASLSPGGAARWTRSIGAVLPTALAATGEGAVVGGSDLIARHRAR